MKKVIMTATVAVLATGSMMFTPCEIMAQAVPEVKTVTRDVADWCTITVPENAKIGDTVEVKVSLKNVKTPAKISCDLHLLKDDGSWGGFWVGCTPQNVTADGTFSFKFTLTAKEGAAGVTAVIYLSPDGTWTTKTANASGSFPLVK